MAEELINILRVSAISFSNIAANDDGGDDNDGGDGGNNNDISVSSARYKIAQSMTKKRKIEEKFEDVETKRVLYKAAVEDVWGRISVIN